MSPQEEGATSITANASIVPPRFLVGRGLLYWQQYIRTLKYFKTFENLLKLKKCL
jgi:hypothetical protein